MQKWIRRPSNRTCWSINGAKGENANRWQKPTKTYSWSTDEEELHRLFTLTPGDLYFLLPLRADAKLLYRALVLVWARVERADLSVFERSCHDRESAHRQ
jgi:hypothetical protein